MSYNGSGTFVINSTGQPVVTGTVISSSTFNSLTADLGTGLSTAITKDGQTTTTAKIPFALGISAAVASNFAAGTVAAPSIYLSTDTGTGFYRIGANNNGYAVSGTKLLDFSSALFAVTGAATVSTTLVAGSTALGGFGVFRAHAATDVNVNIGTGNTASRARIIALTDSGASAIDLEIQANANIIFYPGSDVGRFTGTGLNAAAIGATTPSTGAFTTLAASGTISGTGTNNNIELSQNATSGWRVTNANAGTAASSSYQITNGSASAAVYLFGTAYTTNGILLANRAVLYNNSTAGIGLVADNASGTINFAAGGLTSVGSWSSTGLAVTGTLGVTGVLTASGNLEVGSGGNLVVGGASTYGQFIYAANASAHTHVYFSNSNGNVGTISTSGSATAYNTSSDYRLKENVQPMKNALATVAALKPVLFNWKVDGSTSQGFIAHELAKVVPDCVTGEKDATEMQQYEISPAIPATQDEEGNELTAAVEAVMGEREVPRYQGIDTSFLVATLTAAIQELSAKVATLEAR